MATFAKKSFDAAAYAACRPTYPPQLYSAVLSYARTRSACATVPGTRVAVDVGCGPGLSTFDLVPHFDTVVGVDPSQGMVAAAQGLADSRRTSWGAGKQAQFMVGQGEELTGIADASVDLVVAAQAAHWFDAPKLYDELARILKPGGTFAFWGYGEFFLPSCASASALIPSYSAGTLGKYWQQPGRSIVESLLVPLPFPSDDKVWARPSFHRKFYDDEPDCDVEGESHEPLLLRHSWDLQQLEGYLRTWSAAHTFNEEHGGDVVGGFLESLSKELALRPGEKIEVAWKVGLMMGKKKHH